MQSKKVISIIGATFTGNKGASAMLQTAVDFLLKNYDNLNINIFSYYPNADKKNIYDNSCIKVFSSTPSYLLFVILPLTLFLRVFGFIGVFKRLLFQNEAVKAIHESDLFIDMAGISFSDGRKKYLPFNILCILPPILLHRKVLKYSQAMGPFNEFLNRFLAKLVLPKITKIIARGAISFSYLTELGLKNVVLGADAAFLLDIDKKSLEKVKNLYGHLFVTGKTVLIFPSSVVMAKKSDYVAVLREFVSKLASSGHRIVLVPHSLRHSSKASHNNDLFVCERVFECVENDNCKLIEDDLTSVELRALCGMADFCVCSRFHSMISALYMKIPTLVIGWGHKYFEIMATFGLTPYCIDYKQANSKKLLELFNDLSVKKDMLKANIDQKLPAVIRSAEVNFDSIKSLLVP